MLGGLRKSLITRLMAYFMLVGLLLIIAFGVNFVYGLRTHFAEEILPNMAQYLDYITDDIGTPPDLEKAQRLSDGLSFELAISGPGVHWRSHRGIPEVTTLEFESAAPPFQQYRYAHRRGNNYLLLQQGDYRYLYVIGRLFRSDRHEHSLTMLYIVIAAMGLLAWLIHISLKPLRPIDEAIRRIGRGELKTGLTPSGSLEFKRLGEGINAMAEQIDSMLDAKQQLLLAISHELRSPLTRLRVNLELIDDDDARAALVEDLHEMEALIGMILESERLNQRHVSLNLTSLKLDDLVREVLAQFFSAREISAQLQSVEIQADRTRLDLLIKNLLDNACKYSSDDGRPPEVRVSRDADYAVIEVQDWGCGMTGEQLARAREAFYRADSARQRSTGGFGLGLYLCDRIVRAHDGKMLLQSAPQEGTLVRVELPLSNTSG